LDHTTCLSPALLQGRGVPLTAPRLLLLLLLLVTAC
jgi:hypothetical protein